MASDRDGAFFPDPYLERAIRKAIGKRKERITPADLIGLTELRAPGRGITNLEGLQYCTGLRRLSLQLELPLNLPLLRIEIRSRLRSYLWSLRSKRRSRKIYDLLGFGPGIFNYGAAAQRYGVSRAAARARNRRELPPPQTQSTPLPLTIVASAPRRCWAA